MSKPPWLVRAARKTDRAFLEGFTCADMNIVWQAEVQTFIRQQLFDWTFDPLAKEQDPRLLLVFERKTKTLVAVGAHERTTMRYAGQAPFAATKLEVVAVARSFQGRTFPAGERVSDVLMSSTVSDVIARVPPRRSGAMIRARAVAVRSSRSAARTRLSVVCKSARRVGSIHASCLDA
jgi:hypothetical protein